MKIFVFALFLWKGCEVREEPFVDSEDWEGAFSHFQETRSSFRHWEEFGLSSCEDSLFSPLMSLLGHPKSQEHLRKLCLQEGSLIESDRRKWHRLEASLEGVKFHWEGILLPHPFQSDSCHHRLHAIRQLADLQEEGAQIHPSFLRPPRSSIASICGKEWEYSVSRFDYSSLLIFLHWLKNLTEEEMRLVRESGFFGRDVFEKAGFLSLSEREHLLALVEDHRSSKTHGSPDQIFLLLYDHWLQRMRDWPFHWEQRRSEVLTWECGLWGLYAAPRLIDLEVEELLLPQDLGACIPLLFSDQMRKLWGLILEPSGTKGYVRLRGKSQIFDEVTLRDLWKSYEKGFEIKEKRLLKRLKAFEKEQEKAHSQERFERDFEKQRLFLSYCSEQLDWGLKKDYVESVQTYLGLLDTWENWSFVSQALQKGQTSFLGCDLGEVRYPGCVFQPHSLRQVLAEQLLQEPLLIGWVNPFLSFDQRQAPRGKGFFWGSYLLPSREFGL